MADRQSWHSTIERSPNHKRSSVPSGNAIKRPNVLNTPILNFLTNWLKQDKDFRLSEPNIQSWHDPAPERPQAIADQIPSGQDLNEQELQDAVGIINDSRADAVEVSPLIPKLRPTAHDTSQPQPPTNKQPEYSPPLPSGRQFPRRINLMEARSRWASGRVAFGTTRFRRLMLCGVVMQQGPQKQFGTVRPSNGNAKPRRSLTRDGLTKMQCHN